MEYSKFEAVPGSASWKGQTVFLSTRQKGNGSFLEPEGSLTHIVGYVAGKHQRQGFQEYGSIDNILEKPGVKATLERMGLPTEHKFILTEKWKKEVLKYFQNCFTDLEKELNATDNCICGKIEAKKANYYHIKNLYGIRFIKKYFPDYSPSISDLKICLGKKVKKEVAQ